MRFIRAGRERALAGAARLALSFPRWIISIAVLLAGASLLYTFAEIEFLTQRNDLVSGEREYNRIYTDYVDEFGDLEDIVVVIESDDPEGAKAFAEALAERLAPHEDLIGDIFYKVRLDSFKDKALFYLTKKELSTLKKRIKDSRIFLSDLSGKRTLENFFTAFDAEVQRVAKKNRAGEAPPEVSVDVLTSVLDQIHASLEGQHDFTSPWKSLLTEKDEEFEDDRYNFSDDKRLLLMLVHPIESKEGFNLAGATIKRVRREVKGLRADHPGVTIGLTGAPVLASEEMKTSRSDSARASVVALLGVAALLIVAFRGLSGPLNLIVTLLIGLACTLGFATLAVGHLNILSVAFGMILIGLGIAFGIHLLARYREERAHGSQLEEALRNALVRTGSGITTGAVTTAVAFGTTVLTDFRGIAELGMIAGGGVLICLFCSMTVLPALIVLRDRRGAADRTPAPSLAARAPRIPYRRVSVLILIIAVSVLLLSAQLVWRVRFDHNLLNLQAKGIEAVEYELKIIDATEESIWFGALVTESIEEAYERKRALEAIPEVGKIEGITSIFPEGQDEKIEAVREIEQLVAGFDFSSNEGGPVNIGALHKSLARLDLNLEDLQELAFEGGKTDAVATIEEYLRAIARVQGSLAASDGTEAAPLRLARFEDALFSDLEDKFDLFQRMAREDPITLADLPYSLKRRFVGQTGRFLLQVFPRDSIWDRGPLKRFVEKLRRIDPKVTGAPFQVYESTELIRKSYQTAAVYALVAIMLIVFIDFRSVRATALVLLPLLVGFFWMFAVMGLLDIPLNPANVIALPLVLGIGVDNGVHVVHRFRDEKKSERPVVLTSTGTAIVLTSLTTMIGFGTLMIASHQGIASLGTVLTLGTFGCLAASLFLLPAILVLFGDRIRRALNRSIRGA